MRVLQTLRWEKAKNAQACECCLHRGLRGVDSLILHIFLIVFSKKEETGFTEYVHK